MGLTAGPVPARVDATVKAGLLALTEHAISAGGWSLRQTAAAAFRAVGCNGWTRVDFFVRADGRFLINELNTIPGCTNISMYPRAMEASGVSTTEVIDRLVAAALARHADTDALGQPHG